MKANEELGVIDPIETPSQDSGTTPKLKGRGGKPKTAPRLKVIKGVKLPPQPKATKGEPDADGEPIDRLPTTLKELQATKGGFVASLFLTGKDEATIAKELKEAFHLTDAQSAKITRRITGRARLYKRIFQIMET